MMVSNRLSIFIIGIRPSAILKLCASGKSLAIGIPLFVSFLHPLEAHVALGAGCLGAVEEAGGPAGIAVINFICPRSWCDTVSESMTPRLYAESITTLVFCLPNFARLMKKGAFGPLKSTMPPITPCAWTSFATGKDPSKHGLYDFGLHEGDPDKKKNVNSTFIKSKPIWTLLSEAGKKSIVLDVPLTYPPEEISGMMVSRVMAPPGKNCTYPKGLYRTLRKKDFIKKIYPTCIKD